MRTLFLLVFSLMIGVTCAQRVVETDILIIGGGASGTMAGIQAARMGSDVVLVEETGWLGGMLTAAGVSAIDGNHRLPSGLWGEFRQRLRAHYGGAEALSTGWVSNTLFEPSVGNQVLQDMASGEERLSVWFNTAWLSVTRENEGWMVEVRQGRKKRKIRATVLIDATELGDVAASAGAAFDVGIESRDQTGEEPAPEESVDIIQDLTYVVTLKDYGKGNDQTIPEPENYDPSEFDCACDVNDAKGTTEPGSSCYQMLQYGRLPNDKYMINWPRCGNDTYLNLIGMTREEREEALEVAKQTSLRFIYYIQHELGFSNLGIAKDEYPTRDGLPMIPYHRESRRFRGAVRLTIEYLADPFGQEHPLYRTGIAVGDYPVDHHHLENDLAPDVDLIAYRIPSYNVPLGVLIPEEKEGLIVAEKSISVSHIANGATRLQPVVMELGQAAGTLASLAVSNQVNPRKVGVRAVQQALLKSDAYIMPFIDVTPDHPWFEPVQRIGATGILRGTGIPYKWANQTWFYPDRELSEFELIEGLRTYYPELSLEGSGERLGKKFMTEVLMAIDSEATEASVTQAWPKQVKAEDGISRGEAAVLIDTYLKPFDRPVDKFGHLVERSAEKY